MPMTRFTEGTLLPAANLNALVDAIETIQAGAAGGWTTVPAEVVDARDGYATIGARLAPLVAGGLIEINGGGFTNPYDNAVWVAPMTHTDPTVETQAIYGILRLTGDMGGKVHDALASEIMLQGVSNAAALQAVEASVMVYSGVNAISDARAVTANLGFGAGAPTGTITNASLIRAQTIAAPPAGMSIENVYGLYAEEQSVGTVSNWAIYAPAGGTKVQHLAITGNIGFFDAAWQGKQTVTGSRGANAALASLLTALALYGLVTDSSS